MQITRSSLDTTPGPADWFTGAVYIDTVATPTEPSRVGAASVHFTPGARTAWHTHPLGQNFDRHRRLWLAAQRDGGPVEEIRPGGRGLVPARRETLARRDRHPRLMTHIAIQEARRQPSRSNAAEHVTDEQYGAAPA